MINLAGREDCDLFIRKELNKAGIQIVRIERGYTEVPYTITGQLGEFEFYRAWYYWVVEGKVPMDAANEMYADPNGVTDVRVAGQSGCPPPKDWERGGYIWTYHIDTQEGLNLFAETMRKHGLA